MGAKAGVRREGTELWPVGVLVIETFTVDMIRRSVGMIRLRDVRFIGRLTSSGFTDTDVEANCCFCRILLLFWILFCLSSLLLLDMKYVLSVL